MIDPDLYLFLRRRFARILADLFKNDWEDEFQESIITFSRYFHGEGNPVALFRVIFKNRFRNHVRSGKKLAHCETVACYDRPDYQARFHEILDLILASDLLPEVERRAVGYCYALNHSFTSAGRRMGKDRTTVQRALERANKRIRPVFSREGLEPEDWG